MNDGSNIGKNIRRYRLQRGFTQKYLADKVGVTWEMISRYERGKTLPIRYLEDIADALDVSVNELLQKTYKSRPYSVENGKDLVFIPLFTDFPQNGDFYTARPSTYTILPLQLVGLYKEIIAVDPSFVGIKTLKINAFGRLYVAINEDIKKDDIILFVRNRTAFVDINSNLAKDIRVIGKIIMQEVLFP